MNFEEIVKLIETFNQSGLEYMSLKMEDGVKIKLRRTESQKTKVVHGPLVSSSDSSFQHQPLPAENDDIPKPSSTGLKDETDKKEELKEIRSPIVGTFYRAPSPESETYVKIGDVIKKGTILCIIEAMKLMNEIESDVEGEIVEIVVDNATPVEYNQMLFKIR